MGSSPCPQVRSINVALCPLQPDQEHSFGSRWLSTPKRRTRSPKRPRTGWEWTLPMRSWKPRTGVVPRRGRWWLQRPAMDNCQIRRSASTPKRWTSQRPREQWQPARLSEGFRKTREWLRSPRSDSLRARAPRVRVCACSLTVSPKSDWYPRSTQRQILEAISRKLSNEDESLEKTKLVFSKDSSSLDTYYSKC